MTTLMTGVNGGVFNNRIAAPVAGELVTGASIQLVAQGAANQDKLLYDYTQGVTMLPGVDPTPSEDPGVNRLRTLGLSRAWVQASTNGSGSVAVGDSYNVTSVTLSTTRIIVTFTRAFANALFASAPNVYATATRRTVNVATQSTTTVELVVFDAAGSVVDPTTTAITISLECHGRQV